MKNSDKCFEELKGFMERGGSISAIENGHESYEMNEDFAETSARIANIGGISAEESTDWMCSEGRAIEMAYNKGSEAEDIMNSLESMQARGGKFSPGDQKLIADKFNEIVGN